jgi:hypothetical protein
MQHGFVHSVYPKKKINSVLKDKIKKKNFILNNEIKKNNKQKPKEIKKPVIIMKLK